MTISFKDHFAVCLHMATASSIEPAKF